MSTENFKSWSEEWKAAREKIGDIDGVLRLWERWKPRNWKRNEWKRQLGFRKNPHNGKDRGEQIIERSLLGDGEPKELVCYSGDAVYPLRSLFHNLALANQRPGQVIADAFAVVTVKGQKHPLLIEIKEKANNGWFALVENLQQICLARACEAELRTQFKEKFKGAWGMVLAPETYFERKSQPLEECKKLLTELKKKTEARVAFGFSDEIKDKKKIKIFCTNWQ